MPSPRVVVVYDDAAFPVLELAQAAQGVCEIVWVTGWPGARQSDSERLLRRLGVHIDVTGCDDAESATRVAAASAQGIAVFSDAALTPAAALAEALGLPFHSRETAHRLRDKLAQRRALADAGMDVPQTRCLTARATRSRADVEALGASWPAVLKPRRGAGSVDAFVVAGPDELLDTLAGVSPDTEFVLEDYLADRPDALRDRGAALFSVELLVDRGLAQPIAFTGRFPLEPPLRESGSYLPGDVPSQDLGAALDNARGAATALGVQRGILHVEQKLTPDGPRIVEINGRVGGVVPTLLRRIGGAPILTWAFELALGREVAPVASPAPDGPVAFYRAWLPPTGRSRLTAASGFEELFARAEIDQAWLNLRPGDVVSSQEGGGVNGYVAAAFGAAPSHAALWRLLPELDETLTLAFEPLAPEVAAP